MGDHAHNLINTSQVSVNYDFSQDMPRHVPIRAKSIFRRGVKNLLSAAQQRRQGTIANRRTVGGTSVGQYAARYLSGALMYKGIFAMPRMLKTRLRQEFLANFSTGTMNTAAGVSFLVYGNSLAGAFNTTSSITGAGATAVGGSTLTQPFPGYNVLAQAYSAYKITASSLKVTANPTGGGDSVVLTTWPVDYDGYVGMQARQAVGQSGAKQRVCTAFSGSMMDNTLSNYATSGQALGLTPTQYEAQIATLDGAQPTALQLWSWAINLTPSSGVAIVSGVNVTIVLTIDIEFTQTTNLTI